MLLCSKIRVLYVTVLPQPAFLVLLTIFDPGSLHYFPPSSGVPYVIVHICSICYWPYSAYATFVNAFPQPVPCGLPSFLSLYPMCDCTSSASVLCPTVLLHPMIHLVLSVHSLFFPFGILSFMGSMGYCLSYTYDSHVNFLCLAFFICHCSSSA